MYKLNRKHPVFSKPPGYGSYSNMCAWGKIAIAVGNSPSFFVERLGHKVTTEEFWQVVNLNDHEKMHKEAIELGIKILQNHGVLEVV